MGAQPNQGTWSIGETRTAEGVRFNVARMVEGSVVTSWDYLCSASGRRSLFRTMKAAKRAMRAAIARSAAATGSAS